MSIPILSRVRLVWINFTALTNTTAWPRAVKLMWRIGQHAIDRVQPHRQRLFAQARAFADFARLLAHVLVQAGLDPFALGRLESALKIRNDAFEPRAGSVVALFVRAIHQDL